MKNKVKLIALGTTRMVGKDTFFSTLNELVPYKFERHAFADLLKIYCEPVCQSIFNKPIACLTADEKEVFRPILIETGKVCRSIDVDYWVKKTTDKIMESRRLPFQHTIPVVTDCRFLNEFEYLKNIYSDSMIFVNIERVGAPDPTEEEKKHAPYLKRFADYNIVWNTDPSLESIRPIVLEFYNKYFN